MSHPISIPPSLASTDRLRAQGSFTLEETAALVGRYAWMESALFEVLGGWIASVPELDVKLRLGVECYHHAWHAELFQERLPHLPELNPEQLTVPANDALVSFVEALSGPGGRGATIEKLVGVYRVLLPHKVAAYTSHLANTSSVTDGPTIRTLQLVLRDELDDWRSGELLIRSLVDSHEQVERVAAHQASLEKLLLAAGGIAGPGPIGRT